jgi:hypothetical protein
MKGAGFAGALHLANPHLPWHSTHQKESEEVLMTKLMICVREDVARQAIRTLTGIACYRDFKEIVGCAFDFTGDDGYVSGGIITMVEFLPEEFLRLWAGACHFEWVWKQSESNGGWSGCRAYAPIHLGRDGTITIHYHNRYSH